MKNKVIFCIIPFLVIPFCGFAEESLQEKVKNILNNKTIKDPYERLVTANDTIANYVNDLSFEEAFHLYYNILMPFVEKNVKDNHKYNKAKIFYYDKILFLCDKYGYPEDNTNIETFFEKMIEFADLSQSDSIKAIIYCGYGYFQSIKGNIPLSHEYIYKSIAFSEQIKDYVRIFFNLFNIAENLFIARNIEGISKVIEQMQEYMNKPDFDGNLNCSMVFYDIKAAYYNALSEINPEITAYKDSMLISLKNSAKVAENIQNLGEWIALGFLYYNLAFAYQQCYPQQYDTIYYYLDKALEQKKGKIITDVELEICVYILYAELHFEQKRYKEAERDMLYALSLLEEVNDDNVSSEYFEVYKFLVMYYETMNRPDEALKYHKLLLENEKKRFDNEKIVAMNDMLVKYETEKKKEHIEWLTERNKTARKTLILSICLIAVLLIVLLTLIHLFKLRKKNFELSIYEAALLTELKQTELEQNLKEKEHLQQLYNKLEAQSVHDKQKVQLYDEELTRIKQQLEQKPTKTMIGKLTELISNSYMEKTRKTSYIQKLTELDIDMMELGYNTANEKISNMDMKYIICFAIDMDVKDMGGIFNVEPATIRSVRYRIKKKFSSKNTFRFLM